MSHAMSHRTAGLLAVALFCGAGWALTALVPSLRKLPGAQRLGHAYLLGLAWVCIALYGLSHGFGALLRLPAILTVAAIPPYVALGARLAGRLPRRRETGRETRAGLLRRVRASPLGIGLPWLLALFFTTIVSFALMVDAIGSPASDWDGRMTWGMQARWLWAAGTVDAPVLREKRWFVNHPQYPVLLPIAQAVAMEIYGGAEDDRVARPLYAAFFPALLALVYWACRRWLGTRTALWVVLAAANIPMISFAGEGGARSGYSDLPLACFYGTALILLLSRPGLPEGLAAGLLLAAVVLTKNEGLPLALAALVLGAGSMLLRLRSGRRSGRRLRTVLPFAVAALAAMAAFGLLHSWRAQIPNREDENYFARLNVRRLAADFLPHARIAAPLAIDRMLAREDWELFWPAALVLAVVGARGLRRPPALRLTLAAAASIAVGFLAYTFHRDPAYMVQVTWNRMVLHAALPLLLLFGMALRSTLSDARHLRPRGRNRSSPSI